MLGKFLFGTRVSPVIFTEHSKPILEFFFQSPSSYKINAIFTKSMCVIITTFSKPKVNHFGPNYSPANSASLCFDTIVHFFNSDAGKINSNFWVRTWTFSKSFKMTPKTWPCYWFYIIQSNFEGLECLNINLDHKKWNFGYKKAVKIKVNVRKWRFTKWRRFCKKMDFGKNTPEMHYVVPSGN